MLIAWFLLPVDRWILGEPKVNFGIFVLGGLMIVVGASWTLMYNADVLLGTLGAATRRMRGLAPVLKMSMAYPLRSLFRTGVTLAMFTLVVFTLVVGATTSGAFGNAFNDKDAFGGGFDVRATGSPAEPIADMHRPSPTRRDSGRPTSGQSRASRPSRSRPANSARPERKPRTSSTAPTTPSCGTRLTGSPPGRAAIRRRKLSGAPSGRDPTWR